MSVLAARVAAYLLAPAFPPRGEGLGDDHDVAGEVQAAVPARAPWTPRVRLRPGPAVDDGPVAIVGDGAGPFAVDVARALAGRAHQRVAVVAAWGDGALPAVPRAQALGPAARIAAALASVPAIGEDAVTVGGTVVAVRLPADPGQAAAAVEDVRSGAGSTATVVLALSGPRPDAFDTELARQAVIVLVVPADAVPGLEAVAASALAEAAPAAALVPVVLPASTPLPRALRHRPLVRRVLDATEGSDA